MLCKRPSNRDHSSFVLWPQRPRCARGWQRAVCPDIGRCGQVHPAAHATQRWTRLGRGHGPDPSGDSPSFWGWAEPPGLGCGAQQEANTISSTPSQSSWNPTENTMKQRPYIINISTCIIIYNYFVIVKEARPTHQLLKTSIWRSQKRDLLFSQLLQ